MGLRESPSPISEGMIQVDSLFLCNRDFVLNEFVRE
jgi:hypothetical protein